MKLNGSNNIINDSDVTVTGANKNIGNSLSDVISSQQTDIDVLKGEMKWLYKHGATGSGNGTGSGTNSRFSIAADISGRAINNGNLIILPENTTTFYLNVSATGGASYSVHATWGNANAFYKGTLDASNTWSQTIIMSNITENSVVNVRVTNGIETLTLNAEYVVKSFELGDLNLVKYKTDKNNWSLLNNIAYINTTSALNEGIELSCNYKISIPGKIRYYWEIPDGAESEESAGSLENPLEVTEKIGTLKYDFSDSFFVDDNSDDYDAVLYYQIIPDSGEPQDWKHKSVSFCIFPNGLYLSVIPEIAKSVYSSKVNGTNTSINLSTETDVPSGLTVTKEDNTLANKIYTTTTPISLNVNNVLSYSGNDFIGLAKYDATSGNITEILTNSLTKNIYFRATSGISLKLFSTSTKNITYNILDLDGNNIYAYAVNKYISLNVRLFTGTANTYNNASVVCKLDGVVSSNFQIKDDGNAIRLSNVVFNTTGWHEIEFNCTMGDRNSTIKKYIYVSEVSTTLNWFKKPELIKERCVYRFNNSDVSNLSTVSENSNTFTTTNTNYHELSTTDKNNWTVYLNNKPDSTNLSSRTFSINLGFQYNDVNYDNSLKSKNPIATFKRVNGDSYDNVITIYQDYIEWNLEGNKTANVYIPIEDKYDTSDPSKYHLLTINFGYPPITNLSNVDSTKTKELTVYIDGQLEGALSSLSNASTQLDLIQFEKVNMSINLIDINYIEKFSSSNNLYKYSDLDVLYYYYTYCIKSGLNEELPNDLKLKVLNTFFTDNISTVTIDGNNLVSINDSVYQTLTTSWSGVNTEDTIPILELRTTRISNDNVDIINEWMNNTNYSEQNDTESTTASLQNKRVDVDLKWGRLGIGFNSEGPIPSDYKDRVKFSIRLQGSSTMSKKSKNFTLSIDWKSTNEVGIPVFSPNYDKNDTTTFLPETVFTLKADVIDSSHSNNTSIGKFVNNVESGIVNIGSSTNNNHSLSGHVKKCLDGFPVILLLTTTESNSSENHYILGIYNFNLGRNSYFNLGYCDLNLLQDDSKSDYLSNSSTTKFTVSTVNNKNTLENFGAAEIQGNLKFWDFSQYDPTILFSDNNPANDGYFMFDDLVPSITENTGLQTSISEFVKKVSRAGGYCFKNIGKEFKDIGTDLNDTKYYYRTINTVPNYQTQYVRTNQSFSAKTESITEADDTDLRTCIDDIGEDNNSITPYLNYESALYYYVICMAFGLVDSVQKNLNIKTWNNKTFGIYFYDMDTCLGISNSGSFTSFFCFSDYWKTVVSSSGTAATITDEYGVSRNITYYPISIDDCKIYRDYYPISSKDNDVLAGYDIPSSYLFSIVKYAALFTDKLNTDNIISPSELWARFRGQGAVLESADKFIDNYFASNLNKIPEAFINLNYRNKYLTNIKDGSEYQESSILHGRNINRTRNWLNSRFHILDAYFNLNSANDFIYVDEANNKSYAELKPLATTTSYQNNSDVNVFGEIFSAGNSAQKRKAGEINVIVKAKDYTPLIIQKGNIYSRLFLEDSNKYYGLKQTYTGNENSFFGGSKSITYIDSLNGFINTNESNSFYLKSKVLTNAIGTTGSFSGATIELPTVATLRLNSSGYSGDIKLDSNNTNLTIVDISNSKIDLTIKDDGSKNIGVREINLNSVNSNKIEISNCGNLETVSMNTTTSIRDFTINSCWTNSFDFSNINIGKLTIDGRNKEGDITLKIYNNPNITEINITGVANLDISNCSGLVNVKCNDGIENSYLKSISIVDCKVLEKFESSCKFGKIKQDGTNNIVDGGNLLSKIDFNNCLNLKELILNKESNFKSVKVLNFSKTDLSRITWSGETEADEILDLSNFTGFNANNWVNGNIIKLSNMPNIKFVKFNCNKNNPVILNNNFENCYTLERVYGNLIMTASNGFNNCYKFSVHGDKLITKDIANNKTVAKQWRSPVEVRDGVSSNLYMVGTSNKITDSNTYTNNFGRILTPIEVVFPKIVKMAIEEEEDGGDVNDEGSISYFLINELEMSNSTSDEESSDDRFKYKLYTDDDYRDLLLDKYRISYPNNQDIALDACFDNSEDSTNIRFTNLYNALRNTNYTLFDVYYVLMTVFKESTTIGNYTAGKTTNAGYCFQRYGQEGNNEFGKFHNSPLSINNDTIFENWMPDISLGSSSSSISYCIGDNNPNINMFSYCTELTNIDGLFYSTVTEYTDTKIKIPAGFFDFLTNITSLSTVFYGRTVYVPNTLFKYYIDNKISTISYFNIKIYRLSDNTTEDDVDLDLYPSYEFSDFSDFFTNLEHLTTIINSFNTTYINFSTIKLPATIKTIESSFRADYSYYYSSSNNENIITINNDSNKKAIKFELSKLFKKNADNTYTVENILRSFTTSFTSGSSYPCVILINNNTLKDFVNLKQIGGSTNDLKNAGVYINSNNIRSSAKDCSFCGNGIKKLITGNEFPYNLLDSCKDSIVQFCGFFFGAEVEKTDNGSDKITNIKLPGNLFKGCTKLQDIGATFYKVNFPFKLSETKLGDDDTDPNRYFNFIDCANLKNCSYLFTDKSLGTGLSDTDISDNTRADGHANLGSIPYRFFWHGSRNVTKNMSNNTGLILEIDINNSTETTTKYFISYYDENSEIKSSKGGNSPISYTISEIKDLVLNGYFNMTVSEEDIIYDSNESYYAEDIVFCQNKWYICIQDVNAEEGISITNTNYWAVEREKGPTGYNKYIITQDNFEYTEPVSTITDIRYCFAGKLLSPYSCDLRSILLSNTDNDLKQSMLERNPDYNIITHRIQSISKNSNGSYSINLVENSNYNPKKYCFAWAYDGDCNSLPMKNDTNSDLYNNYVSFDIDGEGNEILIGDTTGNFSDNNEIAGSKIYTHNNSKANIKLTSGGNATELSGVSKFMCPPDLFRYCANEGSTNLSNVFAYGGEHGWTSTDSTNVSNYGSTGRICPYLLKPIDKVINLYNIFRNNKLLSGYKYNGKSYIIPETFFKYTNSIGSSLNLSYAFGGIIIPLDANLNVFNCLEGKVNNIILDGIFYRCYWSINTETSRYTIDGIFNKVNVNTSEGTRLAFALCTKDQLNNNTHYVNRSIYITFTNVFKNYSGSNYLSTNTNDPFTCTFLGYIVKSGNTTYCIHEVNNTVPRKVTKIEVDGVSTIDWSTDETYNYRTKN